MTDTSLYAYEKALMMAQADYNAETEPARKAYAKAKTLVWNKYMDTMKEARRVYEEALKR